MYVELRLLDRTSLVLESIEYRQLPDFTEVSFSSVLSDIGFLEFSYPADLAEDAGLQMQSWVAVAVGSDDETATIYEPMVVDWFIIENTSVSKAADGETVGQYQGRSWMSRLEDACVMPYGYDPDVPAPPKYLPNETGPSAVWMQWPGYGTEAVYDNQTAGAILWDALDKAERRGTLPEHDLQLWFNGYVDSFGYNPEMANNDPFIARVAWHVHITKTDLKVLDGIQLQDGDTVLLMGQNSTTDNGLWVVRAGASTNWVRHWSNDGQPVDMVPGSFFYVRQGLTYAGQMFSAQFSGTFVPGTTPVTFKSEQSTSLGKWLRTWTGSWSAEAKIYDMMRDLVDGGMIEARVSVPYTDVESGDYRTPPKPDHQPPRLEVWDSDNVAKFRIIDSTDPVVFRPGLNMKDHEEATDSRETLNKVFVLGDTAKQLVEKTTGDDAMVFLGRWREELAVFDEVTEQHALEALAIARLEIVVYPQIQETVGIAPTVYLPWSDYMVGDWVLLDIGQGNTADAVKPPHGDPYGIEEYYDDRIEETQLNYTGAKRKNYGSLYPVRVREINVRVSENGEAEVAVTLNDIIYEQNIKTQRLINSILTGQGAVVGAGGTDNVPPPVVAWDYSAFPQTEAKLDALGNPVADIQVTWLAYPNLPDGKPSVPDLKVYMVRWRNLNKNEPWGQPAEVQNNKTTYRTPANLVPGDRYEFIVQGVDTTGNVSDKSLERAVTAARDSIPPPVPSQPIALLSGASTSPYMSVYWNGKEETETSWLTQVPDFSRVELHIKQDDPAFLPDWTPNTGTFSGSIFTSVDTKTLLMEPGTWYSRLVAVDDSGNASPPSEVSDPVVVLP